MSKEKKAQNKPSDKCSLAKRIVILVVGVISLLMGILLVLPAVFSLPLLLGSVFVIFGATLLRSELRC